MLTKQECRAIIAAAKMQGVDFDAYAQRIATTKGHFLSGINAFLVMYQCQANPIKVGGFKQWREIGRRVKKGAHGLAIYLPARPRKAKAVEANETEVLINDFAIVAPEPKKDSEKKPHQFYLTMVFAWSDTEALDGMETEAPKAEALTEEEAIDTDISEEDMIQAALEAEEERRSA